MNLRKKRLFVIAAVMIISIILPVGLTLAAPDGQAPPAKQGKSADLESGHLDFIHEDNTIVINDCMLGITKQTRYYSSSGAVIGLSQFHEGESVVFSSSTDNTLAEIHKTAAGQTSVRGGKAVSLKKKHSSSAGTTLHLENGVWKN